MQTNKKQTDTDNRAVITRGEEGGERGRRGKEIKRMVVEGDQTYGGGRRLSLGW